MKNTLSPLDSNDLLGCPQPESVNAAEAEREPVEYQEGDLEKFFGCDPDFTGGLSTEEHLKKIWCGE